MDLLKKRSSGQKRLRQGPAGDMAQALAYLLVVKSGVGGRGEFILLSSSLNCMTGALCSVQLDINYLRLLC